MAVISGKVLAGASAARARRDFARRREQYRPYASVSHKIPTPLSQAQQAWPSFPGRFWPSRAPREQGGILREGASSTDRTRASRTKFQRRYRKRSRHGRHFREGSGRRERRESKAGFCAKARAVQTVRERLAQNSNAAIASAAGMAVISGKVLAVASAARARRDFARRREQYRPYASVSHKIPTPLSQAQQAWPSFPGRFWPSRAPREQGGILREGASSTDRTRASRTKFQRRYRKRSRPEQKKGA